MAYAEGAKLVATRPGMQGEAFPLGNRPVQIGRDPTNDIVVDSPVVSRQHARIEPSGDDYIIHDAGATNGLFVNGKRVEGMQILLPGDKIQVGEETFVYIPAMADAMETQVVRSAPGIPGGPARPSQPPSTSAPLLESQSEPAVPSPPNGEAEPPGPEPASETINMPRPQPQRSDSTYTPPPPPEYTRNPPPNLGWEPATAAPFAGFWRRFGGWIVDVILLFIANAIISAILRAGGTGPGLVSLIEFLVDLGYFTWGYGNGQTIGCLAFQMRIVDRETGGAPGYGKAVGRYFAEILSTIPLFLGYLWMIWDSRKQTWQDKLAGTLVLYEGDRRPDGMHFNIPQ